MSRLEKLIWAAKRPIVLIGGSRWTDGERSRCMRFAERFALPVATTFRRGHLFDALHPCYAGDFGIGPNPKLLARVKGADLVLLIGGRSSEMPSQSYTLFDIPEPQIRACACASGRGRTWPRLSRASRDQRRADGILHGARRSAAAQRDRLARRERHRARRLSRLGREGDAGARRGQSRRDHGLAADNLPADAIITQGAGNFSGWVHRFYRVRKFGAPRRRLQVRWATACPPHWRCRALYPDRPVVCFAGDGDFLMTGQDFATAVQYNLPVIVLVADNGIYGTIRMHQERDYPGRVIATDLRNPDFVAYALAFGGYGAVVEKTADFPAAFAAGAPPASRRSSISRSTRRRSHRAQRCRHPRKIAGGRREQREKEVELSSPPPGLRKARTDDRRRRSSTMTITITAFERSPDGGKGLARDTRVRWALEEVGQPYEVRLVSFKAMKEPAHLALHPFGQIPTYEEGDLALFETGAIVFHIAERHAGLLPDDANARARAITWMFAALNTVEPPILELATARILEGDKPWSAQRLPLVEDRVRDRLGQLSPRLGDADWLDGAFSAGDLMMVSVLLRLRASGLLDEYPNLAAYVARGEARPAYKRAFDAQLAVNTGKPPTG